MKVEQVHSLLDGHFTQTIGEAIPASQFSHQPAVITRAWELLVTYDQKGVVFADEVGLGKTYEALWTVYLYLLHKLERRRAGGSARVLITVPPGLVEKWRDEAERFADIVGNLESQAGWNAPRCAHWLSKIDELGIRNGELVLNGKQQPVDSKAEGIFLARPSTLIKLFNGDISSGKAAKQFKRIAWDGFIFDEAHQYAKTSKRAQAAQTLCQWGHEQNTKVLLCTATPFQLDTSELNGLLTLVEPHESKRADIARAIDDYNLAIVALREALETKREMDLGHRRARAQQSKQQLEQLLRGYIVRTRREIHDAREYRMISVQPGQEFPWAYWEVRDWTRSQAGDVKKRSFVSTTLGMTVSSTDSLIGHLESQATQSTDARRTLAAIRQLSLSHPKFDALMDLVGHILTDAASLLTRAIDGEASIADHKCVIFASYKQTIESARHFPAVIAAAAHLDKHIQQAARTRLEAAGVDESKIQRQIERMLATAVSAHIARYEFSPSDPVDIWKTEYESQTNNEWMEESLIKWGSKDDLSQIEAANSAQSIAGTLKKHLTRKLKEPWIQYRLMASDAHSGMNWEQRLTAAIQREVESQLEDPLKRLTAQYYSGGSPIQSRAWLRLRLSRLVYSLVPHGAVEYISGDVDFPTRQQIINAFNRDLYPLVLVCSSVGEEGIDLQKQCNRVIHYDLEWNPAKVEQREGRVDRRGRTSTQPVLVQTMKLADTYDERILKRCENRRIWMDLFLCKSWKEESAHADSDVVDASDVRVGEHDSHSWLRDYRLDLQPKLMH